MPISFNKEAKHQSNLKLSLFQEKIHGQVKLNSKLVDLNLDQLFHGLKFN